MAISSRIGVAILFTFIGIYMFLISSYLENDKKYILLGLGIVAIVLLVRGIKTTSSKNQTANGQE